MLCKDWSYYGDRFSVFQIFHSYPKQAARIKRYGNSSVSVSLFMGTESFHFGPCRAEKTGLKILTFTLISLPEPPLSVGCPTQKIFIMIG